MKRGVPWLAAVVSLSAIGFLCLLALAMLKEEQPTLALATSQVTLADAIQIAIAAVYLLILCVMLCQYEVQRTEARTHAEASKSQSEAMTKQLDAAKESARAATIMASELKRLVDEQVALRAQAEESADAAKRSAAAAEDTLHVAASTAAQARADFQHERAQRLADTLRDIGIRIEDFQKSNQRGAASWLEGHAVTVYAAAKSQVDASDLPQDQKHALREMLITAVPRPVVGQVQ